ncbi:unnamed protein product [Phytophthora lilii]|uniref:Unnamed protein product n=1 Tax=Phytophthora lilii TaxID=2077276 RepID=A0A9W6WZN3_9STRA|nr:unnamed protein product [Phytophthora lilii]
MEDRLYVDFLDGPDFAKRDRCWQKKRQVKTFDDKYDKHRMGTNGAQFERALEFVLRSDATTKMPTFAKGTLPMQYERSTTESVERMRKNMGNALWYRHFANNKERHMQTHIYETIGDDEEGSTSDESISIPKLKIRRPRTTPLSEEQHVLTPTKKKRSLPAKKKHSSVKIEKEPLDEVEVPYPEAMNSSDDESDRKRDPTQGTNAAPSMPRHITVTMDEIIVDDDDDDSEGSVGGPKKTSKSPRRLGKRRTRTSITPTCVKKENGGHSKSPIYELKVHNNMSSTEKTSPLSRPHVRRRKVNGSARLHKEAWNGLFSGNTPSTTATNEIGGAWSLSWCIVYARRSVRTARLLADDEDWENEEKGVPGNAAELDEKPVDKHHIKQLNKTKQGKRIDSVGHSTMLRQTTSRMRKEPMPLIDQRIAFANEVLRNLDKEKRRASKAIADTDQPKLARNATRGFQCFCASRRSVSTNDD